MRRKIAIMVLACLLMMPIAALQYQNNDDAYQSSIVDPTLTLTSPNGGESWAGESEQYINWTRVGSIGNVQIEYSKDDFVSDVNTIVATTENDGSYLWTVVNDISSTVKVRISFVSEATLYDISDASFTLKGLISYWPFDETSGSLADDAILTNDGTLTNMDNSDWVLAIQNNGLTFDGSDDYVVVPDDGSLDLTDGLTLSAWVKTTGSANTYWQHRKLITIDNTKVEATLTNFPVLVSITDTDLKDTSNSGPVQPDGDDLRFSALDGTQLSHEIESYDGTTGTLLAWVKIASLSGSSDTEFFLEYGNPTVISQQSPTAVWESGFKGVYHLNGAATDSTSNDNDGSYASADSGTLNIRISSDNDDVEEWSNGNMYFDSSDLELVDDSDYGGIQEVGLRFLNLQVPQGATISNAYIEFETDELDSVTTNINFYAQDIDDAPAFSTTNYDLTDRTKTSAYLAWSNVPAWTTLDEKHQTPDLTAVVQEVVDRSGWTSGNDMVIVITGTGERTAESYFGESANAPLLHFEYSQGGANTATGIVANGNDFAGTATDHISIPTSTTLNITDTLTLEGWISDGGGEVAPTGGGVITDTVTDTLEFDTDTGMEPSIVQVNGDIYAIAYHGPGDDGFLRTVQIANDGQITNTVVDTLEFDTTAGLFPVILPVSGDYFAIAYQGAGGDGYIKTVEIATNGAITDTVVDTLEYETVDAKALDFIQVTGNYFAVVYQGAGDDGFLVTVEISTGGLITDTVIDTLEFDTGNGRLPTIIAVSGNYYAIAYQGDGADGFLKTVEIATNGMITDTVVDTLEFDTADAKAQDLIQVSGDHYAVVYQGSGDDGYVKTVEIATNGAITDTVVDTLAFDTGNGRAPKVVAVSNDVFAIAYQGDGADGFLKTIQITSSGLIADTVIDTLEFETSDAISLDLIQINDDTYAVAHEGSGNDGFLVTVDIDTPAATQAGIVSKSGAYELRANEAKTFGTINTDPLNASIGTGWKHVAMTYDQNGGTNNQKLYVNGVLTTQTTSTGAITTNANDLLIGQYYDSTLDEVRISSSVRSAAWLKTAHNNLNSPGTFMTLGDQSTTTISKAGAYGLGLTSTTALATLNDQTLSASVTGGVWHHLILTYDRTAGGAQELKLYVDGSLADSADHSTIINTNTQDLLIAQGFAGLFDEVRLYNYELSSVEVTSLYEGYLTIILSLPNGGELWQRWTQHYINWTSAGPFSTVKLEYSTDNFVSDINTIVASTPDDGSYLWTLPNLDSDTVRVRASFVDDATTNDVSDADLSILVPSLTLTAPNGAESWLRGTSQDITWSSVDSLGNVKLEYSTDNFVADINTISASTADDGTFSWNVPTVASTTVRVRVSSVDNASVADTSNADFTILVPTLTLTAPDGGESWVEATSHDITWSSSDSLGNVKLEYSTDNFDTVINTIIASTADDGTHAWTVPSLSSSTVRVRVSYVDDVTVNDVSNADLTLLTPSITLTDPDGGESWIAGSSHDITWTSGDSPGNVKLEYSTDNFVADINTIVASTADDGTHSWTIPSDRSSTVKVRASFVDHPSYVDASDADLTIQVPSLTLTAPNGGESWTVDTGQAITWTSQDSLGNVKLEYSTDNFVSDINTIVASTADDGTYYWTIPSDSSSTVRVRVSFDTDSTVNDVSDADFTILVPGLTLTAPDGGESWVETTSHDVTWTSLDSLGNVKLEYSTDNFVADINTIIASTTDNGTYSWTLPSIHSATVRVRVSFVDHASYIDASDADFEIVGLVAWWKLDETTDTNADDSVGTNDGTLINMENGDWVVAALNNGLTFDGVNEYVSVTDATALDLTDTLTLSAWIKANAGMIVGDISAGTADSLEFDTLSGKTPSILHISGNVYAIAYEGDGSDGFLKTFTISDAGAITSTPIDTLEFDTVQGMSPDLVHISGNVFAIAYEGDNSDGYLKTIEIATNGQITDTVIDTLEFDTVQGMNPDIILISGDVYAIAYAGDTDDGWLVTVEIATDGTITDTLIDSLEFDTVQGKTPRILDISGDVYAIAYEGVDSDGFLKTFTISTAGAITDIPIDTLEFDSLNGQTPDLVHVSGDVHAIVYDGDGDVGWLVTVEIATNGAITDTLIDSLEFDTVKCKEPRIVSVAGNVFAIAYIGDGDDGWLATVEIATDGAITNTLIDSLEFDTVKGKSSDLILISGDIYATAYAGDGDDGFLATISITPGTTSVASKYGAYSLGAISDTVFASINDQTISADISAGFWYHVTFTYDKDAGGTQELKLYLNGTLAASLDYSTAIDTNSNNLLLGDLFNGMVDEVRLYNVALSGSEVQNLHSSYPASLIMTAPNGGEFYSIGTSRTIIWTPIGDIDNVKLEYSTDNFVSDINTIVASTTNDGSYSWTIPDDASTTVRLRISDATDSTVNDTSDADFEITILDHWWRFDETTGTNAGDTVGDVDGTLTNMDGSDWVTGKLNNGLDFDGIDDNVNVTDADSLDLTNTITLAAWIKVDAGMTTGAIGDAILDTLEFATDDGITPQILHISGNVYVIVYSGNGGDGFIRTIEIDPTGQITNTAIDTLEFDATTAYTPQLIHVSGNVYAIVYHGPGDDGFLKTVEIATNGAITDNVIDTLEFDTAKGKVPSILHVSGDVFAIAYQGDGDDGFIKTVEIATNGQITDTVIDTLEFDTAKCLATSFIHVSGTYYAIAYRGDGDDGWLKTVEIATNGQITDTVVDSLEFDADTGLTPELVYVSGNVYAVVYGGPGGDGFLRTIEIATDGQITDTPIDTLEFDASDGLNPRITHITGDLFAIVYMGGGGDGFLKTIEIATNGQITDTAIDSLEYDITDGITSSIVHISGDVFAIAYQGNGDDGFLATVSISSGLANIASKAGAYAMGASSDTVFVTINDQTISAGISSGVWTHVVLTYNTGAGGTQEFKLYINGSLAASADYSTAMVANTEALLIGNMFDGVLDEIRLYDDELSGSEVSDLYGSYS